MIKTTREICEIMFDEVTSLEKFNTEKWIKLTDELAFLGMLLYASSYDLYEVENPKEYLIGVLEDVHAEIEKRIDEIDDGSLINK